MSEPPDEKEEPFQSRRDAYVLVKALYERIGLNTTTFLDHLNAQLNEQYLLDPDHTSEKPYTQADMANWSRRGFPRRKLLLASIVSVLADPVHGDRRCTAEEARLFLERAEATMEDIQAVQQLFPDCILFQDNDLSRADYSLEIFPQHDWGEAPDVRAMYGREEELEQLAHWICHDRCRVVSILGSGGIGKTTLTTKLAQQVQDDFAVVIWRSVRNVPPFDELLHDLCFQCADGLTEARPAGQNQPLAVLMQALRTRRCLLILDNVETLLCRGQQAGYYCADFASYEDLVQRIANEAHQSCLLLTSREELAHLALLSGDRLPVRSYHMHGLSTEDGNQIFMAKGTFEGTRQEWETLIAFMYGGNPLALQIIASTIQRMFAGKLTPFLADSACHMTTDIQALLDTQWNRLSPHEQQLLIWLALHREPVSPSELQRHILPAQEARQTQHRLESLMRRSLIEYHSDGWTLQNVVMEYTINCLVTQLCEEVLAGTTDTLDRYALINAQAQDHIRMVQTQLVLEPIINHLVTTLGKPGTEQHLNKLLSLLRETKPQAPGYAAGNILNMLIHMQSDLTGWDFSRLSVWQAWAQQATLHQVNFAHADLSRSVFTETFGWILTVAFSHNGNYLAAGTSNNELRVWQVKDFDFSHRFTGKGHTNWVRTVAFNPMDDLLASGSDDQTVRIWNYVSGECMKTLKHPCRVYAVAFSLDGKTLACGGNDQLIYLWETGTWERKGQWKGHTDRIYTLAFSPDETSLVSGGRDTTVRVWDVRSGQVQRILTDPQAQAQIVRCVAFSPDGRTVASGGHDSNVRLWHIRSGRLHLRLPFKLPEIGPRRPRSTFEDHTDVVRSVAFDPTGKILASGSEDQTVRLWNTSAQKLLARLSSGRVRSVAFNPTRPMLASGNEDQTIRIWEVPGERSIKTLHGYTNQVYSVAFSADGQQLASGTSDGMVQVWDMKAGTTRRNWHAHPDWVRTVLFDTTGTELTTCSSHSHTIQRWDLASSICLASWRAHQSWLYALALSPDKQVLASCSADITICLWKYATGELLTILSGTHTDWIRTIAFSPNGTLLASGGSDRLIVLWDILSGQMVRVLQGHTSSVRSLTFSPDGATLISGSSDHTVRLWHVASGRCIRTLNGHDNRVMAVAVHPDGHLLASGSSDSTVRLWEQASGTCIATLTGHKDWVRSVAFHPMNGTLASGSRDGTIRLWDTDTRTGSQTLQIPRPYEGMNLHGVTGLSPVQLTTLKNLGAVVVE
jgi:WD40 repeat protein